MPKILQFRRGTTSEISAITGAAGELFVDTTKHTVVVMDGSTVGGSSLATESYVSTQISSIVNSAPAALDTLKELASALNNDASFATTITTQLSGKQATLVSGTNIKTVGGNSLLGSGNIALFSGSYTDLTNKPTIPTVPTTISSFTNDSGYVTSTSLTWNNISGKPTLATVATSGSYTDLTNKPTLFSGSYTDLTNKPTLFSGSYTDLTNKPTIPTVPTNVSAFTNDVGYVTSMALTSYGYITSGALSGKQDTLVSGSNIKTINGTSLLGSGNISLSGGGTLDTSVFATKVDLLILDSDDIEEGLTNLYYNDSKVDTKVQSLFVHNQHTNATFTYENGVIKATISGGGGGGIVAPTMAEYQPLATSVSTEFIPTQNIVVDDQYNQTNQNYSFDTSKYTLRWVDPGWSQWMANNYYYWFSPSETQSSAVSKYGNKNFIFVGNSNFASITSTPFGSAPIKVGDTVSVTIWAINSNNVLDKFTATTTVTIAPFQLQQYYNYYTNVYDPYSSNTFDNQPNKFMLFALDWIKKSDFGVGETSGLPLYDPGWLFTGTGGDGSNYTSNTYYGSRGYDSTAQYLRFQYISTEHWNVGYGQMGLETMSIQTQPAYVATFNSTDWPSVTSYINQIVYGNALPMASVNASVYNASQFKLSIGTTNLGLNNNTQFKKYVPISTPIIEIGNSIKGYEIASTKSLQLTGQLVKKYVDNTVSDYATIKDIGDNIPSWVKSVTAYAKSNYSNDYGFITTTNQGSFQVRSIGLPEVAQINPYVGQQIYFDNNNDATLPTSGVISNPGGTYNYGSVKFNGGIYVKKTVVADNVKTNSVTALTSLSTTNVLISSNKIKISGVNDTPGDEYYNNTAVILKPTLNDYNTGTFNNYAYNTGTVTKTGSTVAISNVIPAGASGYSIYIPSGSASTTNLQMQNSGALNIGTGDFTVEGWFKQDNPYSRVPILRTGSSATDTSQRDAYYEWPFYFYDKHNGGQLVSGNGIDFMPQNSTTWVHYAYVRSGSTYKFYVNGTQLPNVNGNNSTNYNYSSYPFWLYATSYNTYVYNYRITIGVARYTASFTPSLSMATSTVDTIGTTTPDALAINGGLKLGNSNSIPSNTNTVGGYLFVHAGALKYKGSNGTVTTIGAA